MNEVHGVKPSRSNCSRVSVVEQQETVLLDLGHHSDVSLTPEEARYLASKLVRLARRIAEKRAAQ